MSAWIESHQALSRHRKTNRAVALLRQAFAAGLRQRGQRDRHEFLGLMHELWWWALDNVPIDGWLSTLTDDEIAAGAQWEGDSTEFVRVLITAGFIDVDSAGERWLHDWYEYAGKLLKKRADNAERMREARAEEALRVGQTRASHVQDMCSARAGATEPNRTEPNHLSDSNESDKRTAAQILKEQVAEIWLYYLEHIQSKAEICAESKIKARIKKFGVEKLKLAMDRFRANYFWTDICKPRGCDWFFKSDAQIDKFLLTEPMSQDEYEARQIRPNPNVQRSPRYEPPAPVYVEA